MSAPIGNELYDDPDLAQFYDAGHRQRRCGTSRHWPGGSFIFDSRNPDAPGQKERTRQETLRRIDHPRLGATEAWNASTYAPATGILTFENGYRVLSSGREYVAGAEIRYTPKDALAVLIAAAELAVDRWLGDWLGAPFAPDSREIIPLGRLA